MEDPPYLLFSLGNALYAIDALAVQEIFFLPELIPITEAPPDIVGVVNLRGEVLPIVDLNLRFGQRAPEYSLHDSVIILEVQGFRMGIIVNEVQEVQNLSSEQIKTDLSYGRGIGAKHFVTGVAKVGSEIFMLLDCQQLIQFSESVTAAIAAEDLDPRSANLVDANISATFGIQQRLFCPNATPAEKATFRERAENLIHSTDTQDFTGLMPLAVIGLNGEYFGLDLKVVREFTDIRKVTPIPCCPEHIVGNMNLRGEIVTLVDIRNTLSLPFQGATDRSKAMIIHINDLVAGMTVDEVFDVMYLNPSEITSVPAAIHSMNDEYLRGTAPYREKMMAILDLPKIITKGDLDVNEEV
jgi:purine-binding chemotaxis protein CheW